MFAPTITGYAFPALSHFIVEGSPLVPMLCESKKPVCLQWSAQNSDLCDIPLVMEGTSGCCSEQIMMPEESCREKVEWFGFGIFSFGLFMLYSFLGAFFGKSLFNRK